MTPAYLQNSITILSPTAQAAFLLATLRDVGETAQAKELVSLLNMSIMASGNFAYVMHEVASPL